MITPFTVASLRADRGRLGRVLLALNEADAGHLPPLWPARLDRLVDESFAALASTEADAFLLAFDQDAIDDDPNVAWFRARYARFVHVDRVVVAAASRRQGRARALYDGLFARAIASDHRTVTLAINAEPADPASDACHAALGFRPVGEAGLGSTRVRYRACTIVPRADTAPPAAAPPVCALCGRSIPPDARQSLHHLTPKLKGGARGATVRLHQICHSAIHSRYTEAELARSFASPEALRADPALADFVRWVRARPDGFHARTRTSGTRTIKRR